MSVADYGLSIYLGGIPSEPFDLDVREMLPGRIAVCMDQAETRGGIYMPSSGRLAPDSGVVVYSGVPEVPKGSRVITRAYDGQTLTGKWIEQNGVVIKLYGVADDWFNDVVAIYRQKMGGEQIVPLWDHVLIEREKVSSSVILPDTKAYSKNWKDIARVSAKAPKCPDIAIGNRIIYKGDCLDFRLSHLPENWGLIRYSQIQAVIE